jgi:hypothetical protein
MKNFNADMKIQNSDFAFVPKIGIESAWLLIQAVQVPVFDRDPECEITIQETQSGAGRNIALAMRHAVIFDAEYCEGTPEKHTSKRLLKCKFVRCKPMERDWAKNTEVATIKVVLDIECDQ